MGLFGFGKKKAVSKGPVERRRIPRWPIRAVVGVLWEGRREYVNCGVENLNMKGLSVMVPVELPGTACKLQLKFADDFIFTIDLEIVWHTEAAGKHCYGARITRMRDSDRERLYQYMRTYFPAMLEQQLRGDTG